MLLTFLKKRFLLFYFGGCFVVFCFFQESMVIRSSGLYNAVSEIEVFRASQSHERRWKILVDRFISNLLLPYILGVPVQSRCWFILFGLWILISAEAELSYLFQSHKCLEDKAAFSVGLSSQVPDFSRLAIPHCPSKSWMISNRLFLCFFPALLVICHGKFVWTL